MARQICSVRDYDWVYGSRWAACGPCMAEWCDALCDQQCTQEARMFPFLLSLWASSPVLDFEI
jgi:hypothetical protein